MKKGKRVEKVRYICEGGDGSEATVAIELRTEFPGIGGTIVTQEGVPTAVRREYNQSSRIGHRIFLIMALVKKLDDYFFRRGVYAFAHIPRPLGSVSAGSGQEACYYEWAFGKEGFRWELDDPSGGRIIVQLDDWNQFVGAFAGAGIDLGCDSCDVDDGRYSKNIIHQLDSMPSERLSCLWKRIDFGPRSITIDYEKLSRFLQDQKKRLERVLRSERYKMATLTRQYLQDGPEKMDRLDIGRLEGMIGNYRLSTIRHHISGGTGVRGRMLTLGSRTESLV
ncbi:MAG: hypothetical protein ABID45_01395 [Patescibacteria group bacterium]